MEYRSTRGSGCRQSIEREPFCTVWRRMGGCLLPETIPQFTANELAELGNLPYPELAAQILSRWLPDYSRDELLSYCQAAYAPERFGGAEPAPLHAVGASACMCLSCGAARRCRPFKDFAAATAAVAFCRQRRANAERTKRSPFWWRLRVMRARRRWQGLLGCPGTCYRGLSVRTAVSAACSVCKW